MADCRADHSGTPLSPFMSAQGWFLAVALATAPALASPTPRSPSKTLLQRGAELYTLKCLACHGSDGSGDGEAAYLLYPKPRDLRRGSYRITSTWDATPTDQDLYATITRGMPGSAMPSWAHLPESDRWALVHYIKSLSKRPLLVPPSKAPDLEEGDDGEGVIEAPREPADTREGRARGAVHFAQNCESCHGPFGQGDGPRVETLEDASGYPIRPRDLTTGVFKGDPSPASIYRRIVGGIADTPMPAHPHLIGDDAWDLVHFVRSLSSDELRERAEMRRIELLCSRVETLPDHPDAGAWRDIPGATLHLMPLWWRYSRPEYVKVQAAHDGKSMAILLAWADETHDEMAVRPQDFRDAAAVQFATTQDPPFFAMGTKGDFVNIWMWKSDRQADLAGFHDIDTQYPNTGIDSYPNLQRSPYEQPMRHAATLEADATFITAWGAGNIVADPTLRSAAEDLRAQGFGTLKARPMADQAVEASGVYKTGSYRVVLRRELKGKGREAVDLKPGRKVPAAFAIWNGSAGDRDGKKSVTIWQDFVLAE